MFRQLLGGLLNNDVTTGESWYYPDLEPETLQAPKQEAMSTVREAFEAGGDRWAIEEVSTDDSLLRGTVKTPLFGFVDDFTVRLQPAHRETDGWKVLVHSASRVGIGDFGQNVRNIRAFYRRLRDVQSND